MDITLYRTMIWRSPDGGDGSVGIALIVLLILIIAVARFRLTGNAKEISAMAQKRT